MVAIREVYLYDHGLERDTIHDSGETLKTTLTVTVRRRAFVSFIADVRSV